MASIIERGEYQYQAIVRRKGYPSQTKTFLTPDEAKKWARDVESQMDKGRFRDLRELKGSTLKSLLQSYLEKVTPLKKGRVAERNRIKQLQRHPIAQRSLMALTARDFAEYRDERLKLVANNTVRLELALLSHVYTIAIKEWSMPLEHVLHNVRKPKTGEARDRRLRPGEIDRLRAAIHRPEARSAAIWLEACIDLAIETGMRAGELLSLDWSQVYLQVGVVKLNDTKNGSRRTVPLSLRAVEVLSNLPRLNGNARVIPNFHDTPGLDRAFKRACIAADIEDLHFHDLRHEAASRLAPHVQTYTLAKIMGWKTAQMAMRYYNPHDHELVETVRRALAA